MCLLEMVTVGHGLDTIPEEKERMAHNRHWLWISNHADNGCNRARNEQSKHVTQNCQP